MQIAPEKMAEILTEIAQVLGVEIPVNGDRTIFFERLLVETVKAHAKDSKMLNNLKKPLLAVINGR